MFFPIKDVLALNAGYYGLSKKNSKMKIFYPYIKLFGKKIFLLTYSFPIRSELEKQIDLDFLFKPKIQKNYILYWNFG